MYKGIVFDLDGTLLNTVFDLGNSVNQTLEENGYPLHTYDEYKQIIGRGFYNLIETSLPKEARQAEIVEKLLPRFVDIYDKTYLDETVPYEGIPELIKNLTAKGIKLGVNSNKRRDYTQALIHKFFPDTEFVEIIGDCKEFPRKPDPAAALEIARLMGLNPGEVVYIGDSKTDMTTGKNAGMDTIGAVWGFRGEEELRKYEATHIAYSAQDIYDIVVSE